MSKDILINNKLDVSNICAVIVTYNGFKHIKSTINSIRKNCIDSIVVIDNKSSDGTEEYLKTENIKLILNEYNKGIAYALNQGFEYAIKFGSHWVLTMDQDSILKDNAIEEMIKVYNSIKRKFRIAILAPKIFHTSVDSQIINKNNLNYRMKKAVITSGSLINVNAYIDVKGFTNKLFIDSVDFDFSLKAYDSGYKIFICNNSILFHSLGQKKRIKLGIFGFDIHVHSFKRKYFMSRNFIYIIKKHFKMHKYFCIKMSIFFLIFILQALILENNRIKNVKFITRGIIDGIKNNYNNKGVG